MSRAVNKRVCVGVCVCVCVCVYRALKSRVFTLPVKEMEAIFER